jgi:hypothetical protein
LVCVVELLVECLNYFWRSFGQFSKAFQIRVESWPILDVRDVPLGL